MSVSFAICLLLFADHAISQIGSGDFQLPYPRTIFNSRGLLKINSITNEGMYKYTYLGEKKIDSVISGHIDYDSAGYISLSAEFEDQAFLATKKTYYYKRPHILFKFLENHENPKSYTLVSQFEYDSSGKEVASYVFDLDTTFLTVQKKEYDSLGRLIGIYSWLKDGDFLPKTNYYYLVNGDLLKQEQYYKSELSSTLQYEYDKAARKKTVFSQKGKNKIVESEEFFDSQNRCIKKTFLSVIGVLPAFPNPSRFISPSFNHPGIHEYVYNPDGTLFQWCIYVDKVKVQMVRNYYAKNQQTD